MTFRRSNGGRSAFLSMVIIVLLLLAGTVTPIIGVQEVEGGSKPNSHAILEVRYTLDRYTLSAGNWKEGEIELELYEKRAPITTANFIKLAEAGFYDGLLFHRVIDDFVIQGGDPNTRDNENQLDWWDDGNGGSDETIPLESHEELTHVDGAVGMARELGDPDSASSQFYICDGPQHRLDDTEENNQNRTFRYIDDRGYAVFAVTVRGIEIVREIATVWTTTDTDIETIDPLPDIAYHVHDHPVFDVELKKVIIIHYEEEKEDEFFTTQQLAGIGVGVIIAVFAVVLVLLHKGRLKGLEKRLPKGINERLKK